MSRRPQSNQPAALSGSQLLSRENGPRAPGRSSIRHGRRGRLSLDLNFKNVTNETYFNGNGSSFIFPAEPFQVLGRVGWSF